MITKRVEPHNAATTWLIRIVSLLITFIIISHFTT